LERKACGISPVIIVVNDKYVLETQSGYFEDLPIYRIPVILSINKKETKIKNIINDNATVDWISLQFVNYGLDSKGIIKKYVQPFGRLFKVHVIMHEL
jgi:hypothetical protein